MSRSLLRIAVVGAGVFGFLVLMVEPGVFLAPFTLCFGWVPALMRYGSVWHPSRPSLVIFSLAVATLVVGTHYFARWVHGFVTTAGAEKSRRVWLWKWTFCAGGAAVCSLLAIVCIVLITHQIYWLSQSSESIYTDHFRDRVMMRMAAQELKNVADDQHWGSRAIQDAFYHPKTLKVRDIFPENFDAVWVPDTANAHALRAVIILPRHPLHRSSAAVILIQPGKESETRPVTELHEVLARFGIGANTVATNASARLLP